MKKGAITGIEPVAFRTQSENHTARPNRLCTVNIEKIIYKDLKRNNKHASKQPQRNSDKLLINNIIIKYI
jgi:hypothetical protein